MPSSICCPLGEKSQLKVEGIFSLRNRSAFSARANSPRRLTQAPRLVDTVTSGDAVTMRAANSVSPRASSLRTSPNPCWVDIDGRRRERKPLGHVDHGRAEPAPVVAVERHFGKKRLQRRRRLRQPLELLPLVAGTDILRAAPLLHLGDRHQAGMVVLVALERQADALDGVGDEADRTVVIDGLKSLDHAGHIVAAEVGHQGQQFLIAAPLDQFRDRALVADLVGEVLAERRAALEAQRRIHRVRAGIDPFPQGLAAGLGEGLLHQPAVFHDHHVPAEITEHGFEFLPQPLAHHRIEALAVIVDHPPGIAQAVLPALQQRLEDIALVHLGVADQGDHPTLAAGPSSSHAP